MADSGNPTTFERLFKRPLLLSSAVLTTVTTLWGVVSIFKDLTQLLGESIARYLIVGLIVACLVPAFVVFAISIWRWWFFLPINLTTRYLHPEIIRQWRIDGRGNAVIAQDKALLFFYEPEKEDLVDVIFSSEPLQLDELNQRSDDCVYTDHHEISKGVHKVYWKPKKGSIAVGKPYRHKTVTNLPFHTVPNFKSMTIPFAASTLRFRLEGNSELKISKIVAYKGSRFIRPSHSAQRIAERGLNIKRTGAPLPTLTDPHNFYWEISNVAPGDCYFVVLYF